MTDTFDPGPAPAVPVARTAVQERPPGPGVTVLAGPTAVGKGTVSAYVREHYPEAWLSVSATTRPARPGEEDGVHYYFTTPEEFDSLVEADEMLEWAVVHGRHRYGTPRRSVEEAREAGGGLRHRTRLAAPCGAPRPRRERPPGARGKRGTHDPGS